MPASSIVCTIATNSRTGFVTSDVAQVFRPASVARRSFAGLKTCATSGERAKLGHETGCSHTIHKFSRVLTTDGKLIGSIVSWSSLVRLSPLVRLRKRAADKDLRIVTILLEMGVLLGLAAFCAVGWAGTGRRLAIARRHEQIREQAYRVIEERVRLAEQIARFGTWTWDPATEIFALSEGTAVISGLGNRPMEVTGTELYGTVHPDDRAAAKVAREEALAKGGGYVDEFRRVFPDGSVRWYRNHGHVELEQKGKRVVGAIMDITGEKE